MRYVTLHDGLLLAVESAVIIVGLLHVFLILHSLSRDHTHAHTTQVHRIIFYRKEKENGEILERVEDITETLEG